MPDIKVKTLHPSAQLPRYAHTGAWGDLAADLYSVADVTLQPTGSAIVPTGIAMAFPSDYGGLVEDRSSLAAKGITTLAGVIDPGYRGEIKVILTNLNATPFEIHVGDRIAQLRIVQRLQATFIETDDLDETLRGAGGFGSTGV